MPVITWPSKAGPCVLHVTSRQLLEHARQCPQSDLAEDVLRMPPPEWVRRVYVYQAPSRMDLWLRMGTGAMVFAMLIAALCGGFLLRHYLPEHQEPPAVHTGAPLIV